MTLSQCTYPVLPFPCLWSCCGLCGLVLSSSQHRRLPCSLTFSSPTCTPIPAWEKHSLLLPESAAEWQAQLGRHHSWLVPAEGWAHRGQEPSPPPSLFTLFIGQLLALLSIIPFPNPLHCHLRHTNTSPILWVPSLPMHGLRLPTDIHHLLSREREATGREGSYWPPTKLLLCGSACSSPPQEMPRPLTYGAVLRVSAPPGSSGGLF